MTGQRQVAAAAVGIAAAVAELVAGSAGEEPDRKERGQKSESD